MSNNISQLNLQLYKPQTEAKEGLNNLPVNSDDNGFLSLTNRFAPINSALMKVEKYDVINGVTIKEIARLENEQKQIENILNANTQASVNSVLKTVSDVANTNGAKKIDFVEYTGGNKINPKTNTTNIMSNIQYSNAEEKDVVEGAITLLTDWLDDYITNYDAKIAEGLKRGDSELKLSFLLEIRKAIENCDFPIGFGDYSDPEDEWTLGSYSFYLGGYDNFYHLNTNRSILLNSKFLMPEKRFESYDEIIEAATETPNMDFSYLDIVFATEEGYNNYCKNYMASVLVHELTHSLHIYNEAVTYYTNDCFDDDFKNSIVEGVDQNFLNTYFNGIKITYGDLGIANSIDSFEQAVSHGHNNNMDYEGLYVNKGFTIDDDRKELMNFVYTA